MAHAGGSVSIHEVPLGNVAQNWIARFLADGHLLARTVLKEHDLAQGSFVGLLPSGAAEEQVADLDTGYLEINGHNYLATLVLEYNRQSPQNCVVVEDPCSRPTNPWMNLRQFPFPMLFHGEDVYFFVDSRHVDIVSIATEISGACYYPKVGFFTRIGNADHPISDARVEVSESMLVTLAHNTVALFAAAYDDESYVVWRKHALT